MNPSPSKPMPSKSKKTTVTVVGLLLILGIIVLVKVLQVKTLMTMKFVQPPESVSTAKVMQETWQQALTSVGSLTAVQGVTVAAELDGKIVEVSFEAGSKVKAGDLLIRQDTSVEEAMLRSAEARCV